MHGNLLRELFPVLFFSFCHRIFHEKPDPWDKITAAKKKISQDIFDNIVSRVDSGQVSNFNVLLFFLLDHGLGKHVIEFRLEYARTTK